ncbi:hypothetical protein [Mesorhizobium sp. M7A.F.Ca.ET.027.03.2.1]|uniref:hypothetical protein n=1 Tax=Mesorhizobium sp. M7A.F.Ca.ET.027.03.2.1 TaxID=2496656 RepID=UPI000FCAADE9|nr:hypothetical protein [Mesorhizobium sp. M7A.F.Ca.ET.027.03.2.1]RVD64097.1 hypothetical protein EN750_14320 [Mesorhizobium sp. M7A.F.Ca.ET.027.03.2.1]
MANFTVEMMRDGRAVKRAEVQAGSDVEAAKVWGQVKVPLGREAETGEWVRVTHLTSGRTSWFAVET